MNKSKVYLLLVAVLVLLMVISVGCGNKEPAKETAQESEKQAEQPKETIWPEKEVEVVYHSKAGSGGDIYLRSLGKAVEPALGQPWLVNNMAGGGGAKAWVYAANAQPDGYVLLGISSKIITAPLMNEMPVSYEDFDPVAMMFIDPMVIFVPADSPHKTLDDIINNAKENPGKQKWAGGTPGNLGFVAAKELMKEGNFEIKVVPFEGGGDAAVSVLGGHLDAGIGEFAEISSAYQAGKIRILAAFNEMPNADIPTVADLGYPNLEVQKLRGLLAPKGTPEEVIDLLIEKMNTAYDNPEFKKYYEANNLIPKFVTKAEFKKIMDKQHNQIKESLENL